MRYIKLFEDLSNDRSWELKALILLCVYRGIETNIHSLRRDYPKEYKSLIDTDYLVEITSHKQIPNYVVVETDKCTEFIENFTKGTMIEEYGVKSLSLNQLIIVLTTYLFGTPKYSAETIIKDVYIAAAEDLIKDTEMSLTPKGKKLAMAVGYELSIN